MRFFDWILMNKLDYCVKYHRASHVRIDHEDCVRCNECRLTYRDKGDNYSVSDQPLGRCPKCKCIITLDHCSLLLFNGICSKCFFGECRGS